MRSSARSRASRGASVSGCGSASYSRGLRSPPPEKTTPSSTSSVSSKPSSEGGMTSARPPAVSTERTYANGATAASSVQSPQLTCSTYDVIPISGLIRARTSSPVRSTSRPRRRGAARCARSSGSGRRPPRRAPAARSRRPPAPRGEPLVRVDRRRDEDRQLLQRGDLTREVLLEDVGLALERVLAVPPEARVDVARAPDPGVVGLGHEGDRAAVQMSDLLRAVFVDDVVVGHGHRVREAKVDLVLTRPGLTLGGLDADPGAVHPVAELADERLVVRRGEDVVVEDVGHRRRQV